MSLSFSPSLSRPRAFFSCLFLSLTGKSAEGLGHASFPAARNSTRRHEHAAKNGLCVKHESGASAAPPSLQTPPRRPLSSACASLGCVFKAICGEETAGRLRLRPGTRYLLPGARIWHASGRVASCVVSREARYTPSSQKQVLFFLRTAQTQRRGPL